MSRQFIRSSCTCLLLAALTLCWVDVGHAFYRYRSGSRYYHSSDVLVRRLYAKVSRLEKRVDEFLNRLEVAEHVVTDLARQECRTGMVSIQTCPGFNEAPLDMVVVCVAAPIAGAEPISEVFNIAFDSPFLNPPILDITINGQAFASGKNCTVDLNSVTSREFSFTYYADGLFPIYTEFTWYACPSALFTADQGLPLPSVLGESATAEEDGDTAPRTGDRSRDSDEEDDRKRK